MRTGAAYAQVAAASGAGAMELNAVDDHGGDSAPPSAPRGDTPVTRDELATFLAAMQMRGDGKNNGSGNNGRGAAGASGGFHGPRPLPKIGGLSKTQVRDYMDNNRCFG